VSCFVFCGDGLSLDGKKDEDEEEDEENRFNEGEVEPEDEEESFRSTFDFGVALKLILYFGNENKSE
jgi:hypothetical protein